MDSYIVCVGLCSEFSVVKVWKGKTSCLGFLKEE